MKTTKTEIQTIERALQEFVMWVETDRQKGTRLMLESVTPARPELGIEMAWEVYAVGKKYRIPAGAFMNVADWANAYPELVGTVVNAAREAITDHGIEF